MERMKLSNKVLIGFFGFIFLYLTASFAELRFTGSPNVIDDKNSIAETEDLSGITYLVLKNLSEENIHVTPSDEPRLEVRSFAGGLIKKLKYQVSGDTLTLSYLFPSEEMSKVKITVFVPKRGFKGMTIDHSLAIVEEFEQEVLHISQNSGRIWMSESTVGKIMIDATDKSYFNISATHLDTLSAQLQSSQVQLTASPVRFVEGSMEQNSLLHLGDVEEIQFKKDRSSRLNLYQ
jgi:hypothetical protein